MQGQVRTEYYHRAVVCQLVGVRPRVVLGLEPLAPGEDEVGAARCGWALVITLKQEARRLWQDAQGLFAARPPGRVVRSEEQPRVVRRVGRARRPATVAQTWVWVSTLTPGQVRAVTVRDIGHLRWQEENSGSTISPSTGA